MKTFQMTLAGAEYKPLSDAMPQYIRGVWLKPQAPDVSYNLLIKMDDGDAYTIPNSTFPVVEFGTQLNKNISTANIKIKASDDSSPTLDGYYIQ